MPRARGRTWTRSGLEGPDRYMLLSFQRPPRPRGGASAPETPLHEKGLFGERPSNSAPLLAAPTSGLCPGRSLSSSATDECSSGQDASQGRRDRESGALLDQAEALEAPPSHLEKGPVE